MHKRLMLLLALIGFLISPLDVNQAHADSAVGFRKVDCAAFDLMAIALDRQDVVCGYLSVPASYAKPDGSTYDLAVVIVKSHESTVQPDPIFLLQGGPGGSVISTYASTLLRKSRILKDRDLVLLEQRGTHYSKPSLYCDEYDKFAVDNLNVDLSVEENDHLSTEAFLSCLDRLKAGGIALANFNSFDDARDIESLRVALVYDKINLYGVSYGSLLAQHYMRLFPDSLRSVVLDGVVAPQINIATQSTKSEDRAFRYFFTACKNDENCNRSFPNLEQVFYDLVDKLDQKPAHIQMRDAEKGETYPALINGQGFYGSVFQMLYSADLVLGLPRMIYQARDGDFDTFSAILSFFFFDRSMSYGMYFAVNCAEDSDFRPEDVNLDGVESHAGKYNQGGAASFLNVCKHINVPQLGEQADEPVQSDVPTLLLSGGFDPITPQEYAQAAAEKLKNRYLFVFPSGAHGQLLDSECSDSIAVQFWHDPSHSPDAGCITQAAKPIFYSRESRLSVPLLARIFVLDTNLLWELGLFVLSLLGLFSAFLAFPVMWMIQRFTRRPPLVQSVVSEMPDFDSEQPSLFIRLASPLALLNGLALAAFFLVFMVLLITGVDTDENALLFGFRASTWPLFLLPWASAFLTICMFWAAIRSWRFPDWSVVRKIYFTLLTICALGCVTLLVYWRLLGTLLYR